MSWGQGSRVDISEDLELICIQLAAHLKVRSEGEPWLVGLKILHLEAKETSVKGSKFRQEKN